MDYSGCKGWQVVYKHPIGSIYCLYTRKKVLAGEKKPLPPITYHQYKPLIPSVKLTVRP